MIRIEIDEVDEFLEELKQSEFSEYEWMNVLDSDATFIFDYGENERLEFFVCQHFMVIEDMCKKVLRFLRGNRENISFGDFGASYDKSLMIELNGDQVDIYINPIRKVVVKTTKKELALDYVEVFTMLKDMYLKFRRNDSIDDLLNFLDESTNLIKAEALLLNGERN